MRDYHFTPESYLTMMREAVPGYDRLEDETLAATGVGESRFSSSGPGRVRRPGEFSTVTPTRS